MERIKCAVCNHDRLDEIYKRDILYPKESTVTYLQCEKCGYVFISPTFEPEFYKEYYESIPTKDTGTNDTHYQHTYDFISRHIEPEITIDIGAMYGGLLKLFSGHRIAIEPADIDTKGIQYHHCMLGEQPSYLANIADLVTACHTLEHALDINDFINEIRKLLKSNGHVYIEVPSCESITESVGNTLYWGHISMFSRSTLNRLMWNHGFEPIEIKISTNKDRPQLMGLYANKQTRQDIQGYIIDHIGFIEQSLDKALKRFKPKGEVLIWGFGQDCMDFLSKLPEKESKVRYTTDKHTEIQDKNKSIIKVVDKVKTGKFRKFKIEKPEGHKPDQIYIAVKNFVIAKDIQKEAKEMYPNAEIIKLY